MSWRGRREGSAPPGSSLRSPHQSSLVLSISRARVTLSSACVTRFLFSLFRWILRNRLFSITPVVGLKRKFIFLNILYCFLMVYSLIGWFQTYLNCCI